MHYKVVKMYFSRKYKILSAFFILLFIPSFFYVFLHASSMAAGLALTMVYILVISKKKLSWIMTNEKILLFFGFAAIILHFIVTSYIYIDYLSIKHILSFLLLCLIILSAGVLSFEIKKLNSSSLLSVLKILSLFIIIMGMFSLFWKVDALGYDQYAKSIFPFSEPSHFALSVSGLLFAFGLYSSIYTKISLIILVGLMGILYPSLNLLVIALSMVILYFISNFKKLLFVVLITLVSIFYIVNFTEIATYFFDRLTFDDSASNLTALVYLQGWEDMRISLYESYGFGVGFQNMGILPPGEYGEMIYHLAGKFKNRNDGGFLAAKLIGEFGILGIALIGAYLWKLFHSIIYVINFTKAYDLNRKQIILNYSVVSILGHSVIIMFFLEMFARGYGYFSASIFLFFVAIFLTTSSNHNLTFRREINQ